VGLGLFYAAGVRHGQGPRRGGRTTKLGRLAPGRRGRGPMVGLVAALA
jgi:hypothetical protein